MIPWNEKVNAISVNPEMATPQDIARLASEHSALEREAEELRAERNEADRRAGASERALEHARESLSKVDAFRREAKEQAGYHYNTSFDVVWDTILNKAKAYDELRQALEHAKVLLPQSNDAENEFYDHVCALLAKHKGGER